MATFKSNTHARNTVYRTSCQEDDMTIEFEVLIGSGVTLTDGDFVNLFDLGEGHDIVSMQFESSDELDTGTATLTMSCGWAGAVAAVFATTSTEFETDPVRFIAARDLSAGDILIPATATTGASARTVRLEVIDTANAATDTAATLKGYARVRRTVEAAPTLTYGWDGSQV